MLILRSVSGVGWFIFLKFWNRMPQGSFMKTARNPSTYQMISSSRTMIRSGVRVSGRFYVNGFRAVKCWTLVAQRVAFSKDSMKWETMKRWVVMFPRVH